MSKKISDIILLHAVYVPTENVLTILHQPIMTEGPISSNVYFTSKFYWSNIILGSRFMFLSISMICFEIC